jgi:PAS domain S-box-containing protein
VTALAGESSDKRGAAFRVDSTPGPPSHDALDLASTLLYAERRVFESIVSDVSLAEVLETLCLAFEEQVEGKCVVFLHDTQTACLQVGSAPSMPEDFRRIVKAIAVEPGRELAGDVAASCNLYAYWSMPIISPQQAVLGMFAVYHNEAHQLASHEVAVLERAVSLARIAIERRRSEQSLRDTKDRYLRATAAAKGGVWDWNFVTQEAFVDATIASNLGYLSEEMGSSAEVVLSLMHPADRDRLIEATERHVRGETAELVCEFRALHRDGSSRWFLLRGNVERDAQGTPISLSGTNVDITDRKRAEEECARQQTELAKGSRLSMLGETVAGITHEITQPLTAVANFVGACETLLETPKPDLIKLREYIEEIRNQSTRAGRIVQSLRSLARHSKPRRERCDINFLVRETVELMQAELRRARVDLRFDLHETDISMLVDRVQLQQVIVNVVRNSCDAVQTLPDERRRIVLRTSVVESCVEIACEDAGLGLPKGDEPHMFDTFFTTKSDGMGMGLAICRSIVEAHGGRIHAVNNPALGATFCIVLPIVG